MNISILCGRATRDPNITYAQKDNSAIARFTLAVDRYSKDNGADFIQCTAFNKVAETIDKYVRQGTKLIVVGHITTGSYTNKEGVKVYTTEVTIDRIEFAESKSAGSGKDTQSKSKGEDMFTNIPEGIDEETLPFA